MSTAEDVRNTLFDSAIRGSLGDNQDLLSGLGNVNFRNELQETLLHAAVKSGVLDSVARLLGLGADPCSVDYSGASALDLARELESQHPGETERKLIVNLIKLVVDPEKTKGSMPRDTDDQTHRPPGQNTPTSRTTCHEEPGTLKASIEIIGKQMAKLSEGISTVNGILTDHHFFVKQALEESEAETAKKVDRLHTSMALHGKLVCQVEVKVDKLTEEIRPLKKFIEDLRKDVGSVRGDQHREMPLVRVLRPQAAGDEAVFRDRCIDTLMKRTEILKRTEAAELKTKSLYEMLYDNSTHTKALLRYAMSKEQIQVVVDCESYYIDEMKATAMDLSGQKLKVSNLYTFADFKESAVYLGGRTSSSWQLERVAGQLALSLAQLSVLLAFGNQGRPYGNGVDNLSNEFCRLVEETKAQWTVEDQEFDSSVKRWLESSDDLLKELFAISVVPAMVATFGVKDGILRARRKMRKLTTFYEGPVVDMLLRKAEENLSR